MASSRARRPAAAGWLWRLIVPGLVLVSQGQAQEAETSGQTAVYVRTDTDHTTIVTPSLHLSAQLGDGTNLTAGYTVDVWTSASIDIRTAATPRVTEQRDQIEVGLDHAFGDVSLGTSYRYSVEYDYESHGGSLGASIDLAERNTTLAVVGSAMFDDVWAAGAEDLKQSATNASVRGSYTQIIDAETLGQLVYELGIQDGYLSSPYRYVRIDDGMGPPVGSCAGLPTRCLPENNPSSRLRNAVALVLQRALGESWSAGGSYRFYFDDWAITSHTAEVHAGLQPADDLLFELGYRFYVQGSAGHWRARYTTDALPERYTSDKELSALSSHRVTLEATKLWEMSDGGARLRTVLIAGPTFYAYPDFPLLDSTTALEVTLSMGVEL